MRSNVARGEASGGGTVGGRGWPHLLFGEDGGMRDRSFPDLNAEAIPGLNASEEIDITQNAPTGHV